MMYALVVGRSRIVSRHRTLAAARRRASALQPKERGSWVETDVCRVAGIGMYLGDVWFDGLQPLELVDDLEGAR